MTEPPRSRIADLAMRAMFYAALGLSATGCNMGCYNDSTYWDARNVVTALTVAAGLTALLSSLLSGLLLVGMLQRRHDPPNSGHASGWPIWFMLTVVSGLTFAVAIDKGVMPLSHMPLALAGVPPAGWMTFYQVRRRRARGLASWPHVAAGVAFALSSAAAVWVLAAPRPDASLTKLEFEGMSGGIGLLHDGEVWAWTRKQATPVKVAIPSAVDVCAAPMGKCAVLTDGSVHCFNDDRDWKIPGVHNARSIGCGQTRTCALLADGNVACFEQLPNGGEPTVEHLEPPSPVVSLAVGLSHTLAATVDGHLHAWHGSDTLPPLGNVTQVVAGYWHSCALTKGRAVCWGSNSFGQIGADDVQAHGPHAVSTPTDLVELAAGGKHTCGRNAAGQIYCWGDDGRGQLGQGNSASAGGARQIARPVLFPIPHPATSVIAHGDTTCAKTAEGMWCAGDNYYNMLRTGNRGHCIESPQAACTPFPTQTTFWE